MIMAVCLNPAIDKTYSAVCVNVGQVNRMRSFQNIAGGKGINVAKILNQFKMPVVALGVLGGYTGEFIEKTLLKQGLQCAFTKIEADTRCNMNVIADDGTVTELLEPGPQVSIWEKEDLLNTYQNLLPTVSCVVLSGSIAPGFPEDIYKTMIALANREHVKVILDSSGVALKHGIMAKPYLCKPNKKELEVLMDRKLDTMEDVVTAAKEIVATGVTYVAVSMGADGLLLVSEKEVYHAVVPDITAVNTVGCGDSAVASFAKSIENGESMEDMIKWATIISAANALTMESAQIPLEQLEYLEAKIIKKAISSY